MYNCLFSLIWMTAVMNVTRLVTMDLYLTTFNWAAKMQTFIKDSPGFSIEMKTLSLNT